MRSNHYSEKEAKELMERVLKLRAQELVNAYYDGEDVDESAVVRALADYPDLARPTYIEQGDTFEQALLSDIVYSPNLTEENSISNMLARGLGFLREH